MPKQTKAATKKKVVSKSINQKLSTPAGFILMLVIALALAFIGTLGYTKYKERDLQAQASAGALLFDAYGVQIRACRLFYPPASLGQVRITASKPATTTGTFKLTAISYNTSNTTEKPFAVATPSTSWWGNVVAATNLSIRDTGWYQAKISTNGKFIASTKVIPFGLTPNCT